MGEQYEPTQANGYPLGRPEGRDVHPMDLVIQKAIEELPAATRLYPDVFAWSVTDAVVKYLEQAGDEEG